MEKIMFGKPEDTEDAPVLQFQNVAKIIQRTMASQSFLDQENESLDTLLRPTLDILFVPASSVPAMDHDTNAGTTRQSSN